MENKQKLITKEVTRLYYISIILSAQRERNSQKLLKILVFVAKLLINLKSGLITPLFYQTFLALFLTLFVKFTKLLVKNAKNFGKKFGFSGLTPGYLTVWSFLLISFPPCEIVMLVLPAPHRQEIWKTNFFNVLGNHLGNKWLKIQAITFIIIH